MSKLEQMMHELNDTDRFKSFYEEVEAVNTLSALEGPFSKQSDILADEIAKDEKDRH